MSTPDRSAPPSTVQETPKTKSVQQNTGEKPAQKNSDEKSATVPPGARAATDAPSTCPENQNEKSLSSGPTPETSLPPSVLLAAKPDLVNVAAAAPKATTAATTSAQTEQAPVAPTPTKSSTALAPAGQSIAPVLPGGTTTSAASPAALQVSKPAVQEANATDSGISVTKAVQPALAPTSLPANAQVPLAPRLATVSTVKKAELTPAQESKSESSNVLAKKSLQPSGIAAKPQAKPVPAPKAQSASGYVRKPTLLSPPKPSSQTADGKPGSTHPGKPMTQSAPKALPPTVTRPATMASPALASKAVAAPSNAIQRPANSISLEIARMVTDFLGPNYPRRDSVGATLNALRTRLETNTAKFDSDRETLIWQVREAIRTEFFKIIYPAPPSPLLLSLVTRTEILLTEFHSTNRPFFYPGARVAVPTEAGSRRAGTTLQLRFKVVGEATVTEALLHLDGPNGGGFQWVQTPALTPLMAYAPLQPSPPVVRRLHPQKSITPRPKRGGRGAARAPRVRAPRPPSAAALKKKAAAAKAAAVKAAAVAAAKAAAAAKKQQQQQQQQEAPPPPPLATGPAALPPTYVPEALLSTSPPPRKRVRADIDRPLSHTAGSLRRALDVDASCGEMALNSIGSIRRLVGIERLVARRRIENSGSIEYFVKWSGWGMREGTWERRESLMVDVPAIVVDFDTRHPDEPKIACHSNRTKTEEEERELTTKPGGKVEVREGGTERKELKGERENGDVGLGKHDVKMEDVEESVKQDGERNTAMADAETERKYTDDVTGIAIPGYVDTPIVELGFVGMVLQVRQPGEWSLHNDLSAVARDFKKRQSRFKQDDIRAAEKLFPLSKTEAKAALDLSLRSHKAHNRRPIPFPRGLGRAVASDTGAPISQEILAMAPPSWESYLFGMGLRPKHLERDLPPLMPSLDMKTTRRVAVVAKDAAHERAVEHRERARRVVRAAYRHSGGATPPTALFRDGQRRPSECDSCFSIDGKTAVKRSKSPRVPERATNGLFRARDAAFGAALVAATARATVNGRGEKEERWFDPVWSCWRAGPGPSVQ